MTVEGIEISHPDKVLFPEAGITKGEVAEFYSRIAERLLVHGGARPLTFHNFPEGIGKDGFFQKHRPGHFPDAIPRLRVPTRAQDQPPVTMAAAKTGADLAYFAGQNTIELHAALSTAEALEEPDRIVFDFDPSDDDFDKVRTLVRSFKEILDELEIRAFVTTTGSRGLHVHLPLRRGASFDQSKEVSRRLARRLQSENPDTSTLEQRKDKRGDKVFVDILRNAYGQTFVLPYSLRARPGAPVATPLDWEELASPKLTPHRYNLNNLFRRLGQIEDPWQSFGRTRQALDTLASKVS